MKKKAAIYLRVSTVDQNYERQEMELKALVEFEGYELAYVFEEKKSAVISMDTREELTKMRQLTNQEVDKIYFWDITRLSRNSKDFVSLVEEFIEKRICLFFKNENLLTLDENGDVHPMTKLQLYILGVFAQMDAENFKAKAKSGKERSLAIGNSYTYNAPYGYYLENKQLHIHDEEARVVRMIFDYYINGKSLKEVEYILNSQNFPSKKKDGRGLWCKYGLFRIISNPVYKGEPEYTNRTRNKEGKIVSTVTRTFTAPAIVDKAIWEKAQERKKLNKNYIAKGTEMQGLLRGILVCGYCGKPYGMAAPNYKYISYTCSDRKASINTRVNCKNGSMVTGYLDYICWEAIKGIYNYKSFKEKFLQEKEKNQNQLDLNLKQIQYHIKQKLEQDKQISNIRKGYKLGLFDDASAVKDMDECKATKEKLDKLILELEAANLVLKAKLEQDFSKYQIPDCEPSYEEKKAIFKDLIEEARIYSYGFYKRTIQLVLKMGLTFNICYNGNQKIRKYFVVDDATVTFSRLPYKFKNMLPVEMQAKDFTVTSNNNELFGEEVFGEFSFEELWDVMDKYGYLKKLPTLNLKYPHQEK